MVYQTNHRTQLSVTSTMSDLKLSSFSAIAGVRRGGSSGLASTTTTIRT